MLRFCDANNHLYGVAFCDLQYRLGTYLLLQFKSKMEYHCISTVPVYICIHGLTAYWGLSGSISEIQHLVMGFPTV